MNLRTIIANLCLASGTALFCFMAVMAWAHTPQVYQTAFDDTCVAIWTSEYGFTDCDSQPMPSRYESTTVMPGTKYADLVRTQ